MPKSEQGVSADRYQVIPRTLIFVTSAKRVLLLKGAATKRLWAGKYNGIGGHVERGEDVLSSARRELKEETGLEIADLRLCGTVLVDASDRIGVAIYVFSGCYAGGEILQSEEGQLEWVNQDDLDRYPLVEDLKILLPRVLEMSAETPPFAARSYYDAGEQLRVVFGN